MLAGRGGPHNRVGGECLRERVGAAHAELIAAEVQSRQRLRRFPHAVPSATCACDSASLHVAERTSARTRFACSHFVVLERFGERQQLLLRQAVVPHRQLEPVQLLQLNARSIPAALARVSALSAQLARPQCMHSRTPGTYQVHDGRRIELPAPHDIPASALSKCWSAPAPPAGSL
jgi:hypothetical protein